MRSIIRAVLLVILFFVGALASSVMAAIEPPPGKHVGVVDDHSYLFVQRALGYERACIALKCQPPEIRVVPIAEVKEGGTVIAYFEAKHPQIIFVSVYVHNQLGSTDDNKVRQGWATVLHETVHQLRNHLGLNRSVSPNSPCGVMREEIDAYYIEYLFRERLPYTYDGGLKHVWAKTIVPSCVGSIRH